MIAGFFDIIILLGAVQGFIVSALLFFSNKRKQPTRLLATLIFLLALASLNLYLSGLPSLSANRAWIIFSAVVPMIMVMPVGPLIFFYTRSYLDPRFKLSKASLRHFYPVIIDLVPCLVVIVYLVGLKAGVFKPNKSPGSFIDTWNVYADIPRWVSVTFYLWLSYRYIAGAGGARPVAGEADLSNNRRWLLQYVTVFLFFQLLWLAYLIPYIIPRYTYALLDWVGWYPVYVPLAVLIYWLGIKGYMMEQSWLPVPVKKAIPVSVLPLAVVEQTMAVLAKAMEEDKLYLNAGLNLAMLSREIRVPQKIISAVLNQHMHKSFNEFVNAYRVEAFKEKIRQPQMNQLTIAGVALECGFNSQASFQRIFKQFTGMVPSAFRDAMPDIEQ